jgi:hypothetical protein
MQAREAKDFLVQQTVRQAEIEGVSLSDLERRMMYFTESTDASEDPAQLNQEFEAEFHSDECERKISALLHHAYKRNKDENPEAIREWDRAIRCLRRGDHYICGDVGRKFPFHHSLCSWREYFVLPCHFHLQMDLSQRKAAQSTFSHGIVCRHYRVLRCLPAPTETYLRLGRKTNARPLPGHQRKGERKRLTRLCSTSYQGAFRILSP